MGKASRGKQARTRAAGREWTAAGAAREAYRLLEEARQLLRGNLLVRAQARQQAYDALQVVYRTGALAGGLDADDAKDYALAITFGGVGHPLPWSGEEPGLDEHAYWMAAQHQRLVEQAEVFVVSPAAHAAAMAAATTLEIADTGTLLRDSDLPVLELGPVDVRRPIEAVGLVPGWELAGWTADISVALVCREEDVFGRVELVDGAWLAVHGSEYLNEAGDGALRMHRDAFEAACSVAFAVQSLA